MKIKILLFSFTIFIGIINLNAQTLPINEVSSSLPCLDKNFNVRVVVTVDSTNREPLLTEEEINTLLSDASYFFSPICMSFTSCSYDVIPNYSYNNLGTESRRIEMGVVYHYPRRITLFVVEEMSEDTRGKCGYSQLGGLNTRNNAQIFVSRSCSDGLPEQFAHHMGTLLGLLDTNHEPGSELVDGSNCTTAGDMICDTPADSYGVLLNDTKSEWVPVHDTLLVETFLSGCDYKSNGTDINGQFFNPNTTNIMSTYPCKCAFTREQFLKMVDNYDSTNILKY